MEKTGNTFLKSIMTTGAVTGLVMILYTMILYWLKLDDNTPLSYISYLIIIGAIIYGIKQIRDNVLNGFISYGKGVGSGVLISFFASIIVAFYIYLQMRYFDPNLMAKTIETAQQKWMNSGMSDEEIETMTSLLVKFATPGFTAFSTIFGFTLIGTIFSLIIAAFFKKEPDIFSGNILNNSN